MRGLLAGAPTTPWDERPIREELFSVERLEEHARSLAAAQVLLPKPDGGDLLARRLAQNETVLTNAYRDIAAAVEAGAAITPAAEWLVDNFHVVEAQIRNIRSDLPRGYYRQLPKLAAGPFAGLPQVFAVAWALVAHTDSRFDPEQLRRYIRAYQEVRPLTIGELWAVAITLRIVLVENLRRLADRVVASRAGRRAADELADRLLGAGGRPAEPPAAVLASFDRPDLPDAFFVQLVQRLRDQDPGIAPALTWLDERLATRGETSDSVVREEQQRQVSGSVTVRNIVTSMRFISEVDWTELFESMSLVDDVLRAGSLFAQMDFPTRNLYRTAIEDLARGSGRAELEVARSALLMAGEGRAVDPEAPEARLGDPGYYLIAGGRARFETMLGYRPPFITWLAGVYRALGIGGYVSAGAIVATICLALPLSILAREGVAGPWLAALAVLGVAPAVDLAVAVVNYLVTRGFRATLLPAVELKGEVPARWRTLVAVPTLLTSPGAIDEQVGRLEIHYLASPPGELYFALLTDWGDAPSEHMEGDVALLAAAREAVARLNAKYGPASAGERFLLLHRRRVWNDSERRWIGWERKRGKLLELNQLLRGGQGTTYLEPVRAPLGVRYVITLDADTQLPRETVPRLIGKMAHPLNRPRLDPKRRRVVEGYGILQPRVTPSLPVSHEGSLFLRVFSRASGIDPYAAAVSDVYQDLFGEGSYTGKGIYDVDAFEAALAGRAPESAMLSHDLFEGIFARAGLASDVEVVEDFPARYDISARRHHRWVRGDWQLLPWMLGPLRGGVPAIGRWKMLDNVRRSLSAPSLVAALVAGWIAPADSASVWTAFILATMALPPLIPVLGQLRRRPGVAVVAHLRTLAGDLRLAFTQLALMVVFLADQAWLMGDAILRTLWRVAVSRRHLLEWTPMAQTGGADPGVLGFFRRMAGGVAVGVGALAAVALADGGAWPLAAGVTWGASPAVAWWASRSRGPLRGRALLASDARDLRLVARRTWRFFETFVTAASNMLPPDNFQEAPEAVVAHRTSPTNLGLYLLSVAAAKDLGWIGVVEALERLEATLATMQRLEKHRGHFYNWYDTSDLRTLDPKYVSSVDSGNLCGHLVALAGVCRDWARSAEPGDPLTGVRDAITLAQQAATAGPEGGAGGSGVRRRLEAEFQAFIAKLDSLEAGDWAALAEDVEPLVDAARALAIEEGDLASEDVAYWVEAARKTIKSRRRDLDPAAQAQLGSRLAAVAAQAQAQAQAMEFGFLLDPDRLLLSIGFQAAEGVLDPNCYDLLASEARLASFMAIAKGDAPVRHWFRLGRSVTNLAHGAALISWSGSMFEYLMPSLVMRAPRGTLLEQTNRLVVRRQIDFGRSHGGPWGVSEAAYNSRDVEFTYQYSNFGVPGLGLKRGLADNFVVAPYATALAAMVDPHAAVRNFHALDALGARGRYGFYESIDFTPSRVPEGERGAIVRTFMAHHQGMSIVAIANALFDGLMRARFHAEPVVQATELLLQERVPRDIIQTPPSVAESATARAALVGGGDWRTASPWSATPDTQMLSNGRYSVMLTAAGSGYSSWRGIAVTRWREDATCDDWGSYIFLRDVGSGEVWSATVQPVGAAADSQSVIFNEHRAEFARQDGPIATALEIVVSAEDDAEVRRVTVSNSGVRAREIEVTSYAELALAPPAADIAHPAFSKLFVETEHLAGSGALVATRRRRSPDEREIWAAHIAVVDGETVGHREFETDRARFIGRGADVRSPIAVVDGRPLLGATGPVLDPIFALRRRLRIEPGRSVRIDFWTLVAESRAQALDLVDKHQDRESFERAATLAWTQAQVQLHHLGIDRGQAATFQRLGGHVLFATPSLRPLSEVIEAGGGGQPGLWGLGISGDLPIILVRIDEASQLGLAREALLAVEYLRAKWLAVDLVILNDRAASYVQELQVEVETLVRASQSRLQAGEDHAPGHIFILRADLVAPETRDLLLSVARVVLVGERGRLADQLDRAIEPAPGRPTEFAPRRRGSALNELRIPRPAGDVEYFNGMGGFAANGTEYVTVIGPGQQTPAPWINVIANASFGFQVSSDGGGYAWSCNAREHQLTPWSNDPVSDPAGQALFVRDERTGELWTPTAHPRREEAATYVARHGFGYSRFEHGSRGLTLELLEFAPLEDPVRISRLTIRNTGAEPRRLSVTGYAEWVLGASRAATAPFVHTKIDSETRALLACSPWNPAFAGRVAFIDLGGRQTSWTGDRREFIGRNGALGAPAALSTSARLSGRTGSGLDSCGALQTVIELAPGGVAEIVFCLGDAEGEAEAKRLVQHYRQADLSAELGRVRAFWEQTLGSVQVKTPDRSMDIMLNGWLLYQTLACRFWARAGFYQASGAFGFRDQLQDVMALVTSRPGLVREHLLRAAAQQFPEGDVLHWWLPHSGQGVRTRITDDRLWLPFAVAHYIDVTGDAAILDETLPFLDGPVLQPGQMEAFLQWTPGTSTATLYEHCARAIDLSLPVGRHGAPLMGGGDWNDGMNRVGQGGEGESVWLGWFLIATVKAFAGVAEARGDAERTARWRAAQVAVAAALEREAWDGDWYRRGWFDDGTPLGAAASDECRIDSIAQSWAVLSGAGPPERAARAMGSVERELVLPQESLALLFTPPFDRTTHDPGYIKGYPPGLRENGGQYTHAAQWSVMAFAALGEGDKAAALFWMLNPINHARTRTDAHRYKGEPYVVAADVYASPSHVGRSGWTWYTGSAGWMQRAGLESILGLRLRASVLELDPCIPKDWPKFELSVRRGAGRYDIIVENPDNVSSGVAWAQLDGVAIGDRPLRVGLTDDGRIHTLKVRMGSASQAAANA
ncbi:MAG: GH36-type glycosyl hydrolase domain-containing protein [Pseudomonadota bacterium]